MTRALSVAVIVGLVLGLGAAAHAACIHIAGARVWLPGGKADNVDIIVDGATIKAVAAGLPDAGCARIDAAGKVVTAGLVDAWSGLGIIGVELERTTVDVEIESPWQDEGRLIRAAARASLAYDTRSLPIAVARLGGVTSTVVVPRGGIIAGQGLWADLAGGRSEALRKDPAVMVASYQPHATAAAVLDVALREAALWTTVRAKRLEMRHPGLATKDLDLDALGPVVAGEVPLAVAVDRASDIEGLLAMAAGTKIRLVVVGGAEAWLVADALAARRVPVVVDPLLNAPVGFDELRAREDNIVLLNRAGVALMMSVFNTHQTRKLRQVAGNAVRAGLPWEAALMAITETPAQVFGLTRHGRIEAGAVANFVIWSGDPFELATRADGIYIHGVAVPLRSRQTELLERYRRL